MLPFDNNIISVIDEAYRVGFNVPEKFFKDNITEVDTEGKEIYYNSPMYVVKPKGVEFSYIVYWTGKRFLGGYVSINNNYSSVQRGRLCNNGFTLFAAHVPEVRRCFKKLAGNIAGWICRSFILDDEGTIFSWGKDYIENYGDMIKSLTGDDVTVLQEKFDSGEKTYKPEGFVSAMIVKNPEADFQIVSKRKDTISKAWRDLYADAELLPVTNDFTFGMESYMRMGYAKLKAFKKIN